MAKIPAIPQTQQFPQYPIPKTKEGRDWKIMFIIVLLLIILGFAGYKGYFYVEQVVYESTYKQAVYDISILMFQALQQDGFIIMNFPINDTANVQLKLVAQV